MHLTARRRVPAFLLAALLLGPLLALPATHARAAPANRFVVPTSDGPVVQTGCTSILDFCSLREALAASADGDTIQFNAGTTGAIHLDPAQGALAVAHSVTIRGPGAAVLAVDGGANAGHGSGVMVFLVTGTTVTISGLTIRNGFGVATDGAGGGGGGIRAVNSILTVSDCVLTGNYATGGGGGISATFGELTVTNSTLSDNSAGGGGGGIWQRPTHGTITGSVVRHNIAPEGGGIFGDDFILSASTIADNIATGNGGGIATGQGVITNTTLTGNRAVGGSGGALFTGRAEAHVVIVASTITGNTAEGAGQSGGGIRDIHGITERWSGLTGTLIAGNGTMNGATAPDLSGRLASDGFNLIGDGTGSTIVSFANAGTDRVGTALAPLDARFDPRGVRDNGGPTPTVALLPNSPAIDAGGGCPATDQRGQPRIGNCDVGAYEYQPVTPTVADAAGPLGGGPVTFQGTGFQTGSRLTVGATTVTATSTDVSADGTRLTLPVPAHAAGTVGFAVTNPGGGQGAAGTLTYTRPAPLPAPAPGGSGGGGAAPLPGSRPAGPSPPAGSPSPLPTGR